MRRIRASRAVWRFFGVMTVLAAAGSQVEAGGKGGTSPLLPGNASFRGLSYDEWNLNCSEYVIASGLGGQDLPDTVDGVRYLAGAFSPGEYEFSIQVRPGTAFVYPAFFVYGELYEDGSEDDPIALADLILLILDTTTIELSVDGKIVQQGTASELEEYQYGISYYDEPIYYEEPQPREGAPDAVAALWGFGVGAILTPLPAGKHTVKANVNSAFFGEFKYTYHIDVVPPGKAK